MKKSGTNHPAPASFQANQAHDGSYLRKHIERKGVRIYQLRVKKEELREKLLDSATPFFLRRTQNDPNRKTSIADRKWPSHLLDPGSFSEINRHLHLVGLPCPFSCLGPVCCAETIEQSNLGAFLMILSSSFLALSCQILAPFLN